MRLEDDPPQKITDGNQYGTPQNNQQIQTQSNKNQAKQSKRQSHNGNNQKRRLNIALVSDFYYPFVGGVQMHIKQLATHLHRHESIGNVIVITHKYDHHELLKYTGVKHDHGFRVYYLNVHYSKQYMITYPTFIFNFRSAAKILTQQSIDIVHCHQTGSTLALEFIFFANILGIRTILTEHSLYGFRSFSDINFNRACQFFISLCDKVIAVSKTTRNNIILRAKLDYYRVVVIPNGVRSVTHVQHTRKNQISSQTNMHQHIIRIISVGRMTYRRGTDLLIQILPQLCRKHENIQILIVGDGVKRKALENIIQMHQLYSKVKMLGIISNHDVLLQKMAECDIFLNTPLTQSFGIALAEAAMLGLCCVSTNVGGVQEAIPSCNLLLTDVQPSSLLATLQIAIKQIRIKKQNKKLSSQGDKYFEYRWDSVCERTVQLYKHVHDLPVQSRKNKFVRIVKRCSFFQTTFALLALVLGIFYSFLF